MNYYCTYQTPWWKKVKILIQNEFINKYLTKAIFKVNFHCIGKLNTIF